MVKGKVLRYFAGGNTAHGFHDLFSSTLEGLNRLFILKGGPGTGKSTLMRDLADSCIERGYDVELVHCASDPDSLDGVIIPAIKCGIVDGTAPHIVEPELPGVVEEYVNLGSCWDSLVLQKNREEIIHLTQEIKTCFKKAYEAFSEALSIHDEWEKIYIDNMDFEKANEFTDQLISLLLGGEEGKGTAAIKHRFLGAATPKGAVDFVPELTDGLTKRYFIKGRPGSGKSTMLKKIASAAQEKGFDTEIYHCGFDPNSLDMVIVRELGFAIFDSTAPHEYFPEKPSDEIVDMYPGVIKEGTDEDYAKEIADIAGRYKNKMAEGTAYLTREKELHDELERIYVQAMDFDKVKEIQQKIKKEINQLLEQL